MYAMPKIHVSNNILAKTRRGLPPKLESFEKNVKESTSFLISSPKPVFHISNSKRFFEESPLQEQLPNPQHEEMVKYVQSTWTNVIEQYESKTPASDLNNNSKACVNAEIHAIPTSNVPKIFYFTSKTATVPKFEPFDLESFWSNRIYQKLISA